MRIIALALGSLLLIEPAARAADPAPKKSACRSLAGDWAGDFDGTFAGEWSATFTQTGPMLSATGNITFQGDQSSEGEGGGGVKCEGGKTAIAGSGSAHGKSGSFAGISDASGRKLSGTWWANELSGTWRGERVEP